MIGKILNKSLFSVTPAGASSATTIPTTNNINNTIVHTLAGNGTGTGTGELAYDNNDNNETTTYSTATNDAGNDIEYDGNDDYSNVSNINISTNKDDSNDHNSANKSPLTVEICVHNDNSTDNSLNIIKHYQSNVFDKYNINLILSTSPTSTILKKYIYLDILDCARIDFFL